MDMPLKPNVMEDIARDVSYLLPRILSVLELRVQSIQFLPLHHHRNSILLMTM